MGNIQNASGATVANATLEAQNEATGVKTTVVAGFPASAFTAAAVAFLKVSIREEPFSTWL